SGIRGGLSVPHPQVASAQSSGAGRLQWRCGGQHGVLYTSLAQLFQATARTPGRALARAGARRVRWRGPKWKARGGRGCGYGWSPARGCPKGRAL
ncbi:MAG: hypothetical protein ACK55Z_34890, partial [bacterium]